MPLWWAHHAALSLITSLTSSRSRSSVGMNVSNHVVSLCSSHFSVFMVPSGR